MPGGAGAGSCCLSSSGVRWGNIAASRRLGHTRIKSNMVTLLYTASHLATTNHPRSCLQPLYIPHTQLSPTPSRTVSIHLTPLDASLIIMGRTEVAPRVCWIHPGLSLVGHHREAWGKLEGQLLSQFLICKLQRGVLCLHSTGGLGARL